MFSWKEVKRRIRKLVHKVHPYGVDRSWKAWNKYVWPAVVKVGPPADLSEKESRRANNSFLVDVL